jgi:hypothetical protein
MYKIEKNIPIPEPVTRPAKENSIPWELLEPGDSLFLPGYSTRTTPGHKQLNMTLLNFRFPGRKFTSRRLSSGGVTGIRVWRIA